jgi:rhodanese-related sulfurtransferase
MKKMLLVAATMSLVSATLAQGAEAPQASGAAKAPAFKAHLLTKDELDGLLATPNKVLVVDVRRPDEVSAKGSFPVYLSIQYKDLESSLPFIPKDRSIVTISNHAGRAGKAADLLAAHGFKVAGAAGSETYEKEGGKGVAHIAVPAPTPASADAHTAH